MYALPWLRKIESSHVIGKPRMENCALRYVSTVG